MICNKRKSLVALKNCFKLTKISLFLCFFYIFRRIFLHFLFAWRRKKIDVWWETLVIADSTTKKFYLKFFKSWLLIYLWLIARCGEKIVQQILFWNKEFIGTLIKTICFYNLFDFQVCLSLRRFQSNFEDHRRPICQVLWKSTSNRDRKLKAILLKWAQIVNSNLVPYLAARSYDLHILPSIYQWVFQALVTRFMNKACSNK